MDCEDTLPLEEAGEENHDSTDDESRDAREPCAVLRVARQGAFAGAEYKLSKGMNMIGRSAETCNICIPLQVLSKQHACIMVQRPSRGDLVYDVNSRNGTKRGKMRLEPDVRYELRHGDQLYFGGLQCVYSRLDLLTTVLESPFPVQAEVSRALVAGKLFDTSAECCSDSDVSVDMLQIAEDFIDPQDSLAETVVDTVSSAAAVSPEATSRTLAGPASSSTPSEAWHGQRSSSREQLPPSLTCGDDDIYNMATQAYTVPVENDADETFRKLDDTIGPNSDTVPLHNGEDLPVNDKPGARVGEVSSSRAGAHEVAHPGVADDTKQNIEEVAVIQQAARVNLVPTADSEPVNSRAAIPSEMTVPLKTTDSDNESTLLISDGEDTDSKGIALKDSACSGGAENLLVGVAGSTTKDVSLRTGKVDLHHSQQPPKLSSVRKTMIAAPKSGSLRGRSTARRKGRDGIPLPTFSNPPDGNESLLQPRDLVGANENDSYVASSSAEGIADSVDDGDDVSINDISAAVEMSTGTTRASCTSAGTGLLPKPIADAETVPCDSDDDTVVCPIVSPRNRHAQGATGRASTAAAQQQPSSDAAAACSAKESVIDGSTPTSPFDRPAGSRSEETLAESQELPSLTRHRGKATSRHAGDASGSNGDGDKSQVTRRAKRKMPTAAGSIVLASATAAAAAAEGVSDKKQVTTTNAVGGGCSRASSSRSTQDENSSMCKSDESIRGCDVRPNELVTTLDKSDRRSSELCSAPGDRAPCRFGRKSRAGVCDNAADCKQATARPSRRSAVRAFDEGSEGESTAVQVRHAPNHEDSDHTSATRRRRNIANSVDICDSTASPPRTKRSRCSRAEHGVGTPSIESAKELAPIASDKNAAHGLMPVGDEPKDGQPPCDATAAAVAKSRCSEQRTAQADDLKPIALARGVEAAGHSSKSAPPKTETPGNSSSASKRTRKTAAASEALAAVGPEIKEASESASRSQRTLSDAALGTASSSKNESPRDRRQQPAKAKTRPTSAKQTVSCTKANTLSSPTKERSACETAEPKLLGAELAPTASSAPEADSDSVSGRCRRSRVKRASLEAPIPCLFPPVSKPKIMFTGISETEYQEVIKRLGGCVVDSVSQCTHLVTDEVRRTFKFLCGVARGIPIVTPKWLTESSEASTFLDVTQFLLRDKAKEKLYDFSLPETLQRAKATPLFKDYKVYATKSVKPPPEQIKEVVTLAGGCYVKQMPKPGHVLPNTVVISCPEDAGLCKSAAANGVFVVTAEFLLTGILRHQIDTNAYALAL